MFAGTIGLLVAFSVLAGCTVTAQPDPTAAHDPSPTPGSSPIGEASSTPGATPSSSTAASPTSPEVPAPGPVSATGVPIPETAENAPTVTVAASEAINLARRDLASRLSLTISQVAVTSVNSVDWPSSALGCPQPGRSYAQVITPGYRIILLAGARGYEYHSDGNRRVILCANPQP